MFREFLVYLRSLHSGICLLCLLVLDSRAPFFGKPWGERGLGFRIQGLGVWGLGFRVVGVSLHMPAGDG